MAENEAVFGAKDSLKTINQIELLEDGTLKIGSGSAATANIIEYNATLTPGILTCGAIKIGANYYWTDSGSDLRSHTGAPTSLTDASSGAKVGPQS
jgi:hypothetical protein